MKTETMTVWEFLEQQEQNPRHPAQKAQDLYEWGLNCSRQGNPFLVYLDLTGYSDAFYGDTLTKSFRSLGYLELDYLGDALKEYANDPHGVLDWVNALMQCEEV